MVEIRENVFFFNQRSLFYLFLRIVYLDKSFNGAMDSSILLSTNMLYYAKFKSWGLLLMEFLCSICYKSTNINKIYRVLQKVKNQAEKNQLRKLIKFL